MAHGALSVPWAGDGYDIESVGFGTLVVVFLCSRLAVEVPFHVALYLIIRPPAPANSPSMCSFLISYQVYVKI